MKMKVAGIVTALAALAAQSALAEDASCKNVRFADVGWSDIAATTGMASVVLEGLGYKPNVTIASIPIAFAGMKKKQIDVFLGYWNPSMTPDRALCEGWRHQGAGHAQPDRCQVHPGRPHLPV